MLKEIKAYELQQYMNFDSYPEEKYLEIHWLKSISKIRDENKYNIESLILSNPTLQIIVGLYASNNDNAFQYIHWFPHDFTSISFMSSSFVRALPSIFKNIQVVYHSDSKHIYALRLKDISDDIVSIYFDLMHQNKIDNFLASMLRINKKIEKRLKLPQIPTYYELNKKIDSKIVNIERILTNVFAMELFSQCMIRNFNITMVPFRDWTIKEIENSNSINELCNYFERIIFDGEGEPWKSEYIFFIHPNQEILDYMNNQFFIPGGM